MPKEASVPVNTPIKSDDYQKVGFLETLKIARWAFSIFYKYHPRASLLMVFSRILWRLQSIATAYLTAKIINVLVDSLSEGISEIRFIYPYMGYLLGLNFFSSMVNYAYNRSRSIISQNSSTFLRRELYLKIKYLGITTLENPEVNNKISRASNYLSQTESFFMAFIDLNAGVVRLFTTLSLIIGFMPELGIIILLATIPYGVVDRIYRKKLYRFDYINTEEERKHGAIGYDLSRPQMIVEVLTTGAFSFLDKKYVDFKSWYNSQAIKITTAWNNWGRSVGIFSDTVVIIGYIGIIKKFLDKVISVGNVTFWISTLDNLRGAVSNTTTDINNIIEKAVRVREAYSFFKMEPLFSPGKTFIDLHNEGPEIKVDNVSFKYPSSNKYVIDKLNLSIQSKEKIAIVGKNGAGKTTLVKLISRFYPVERGEITINGINVNELEPGSLYDNIGILQQDYNQYPYLTVKENICVGKSDIEIDEKRMVAAAESADIKSFVEDYPMKYDQILSERYKGGIRPSTGQWQKIALARFFYRDAPLVIFDEPTAAIDAASEAKIFSKIYEFFTGKTVIIISHRFSTVRNADRIIVLDDGKIVEQGSHEELLKLNGKYAEGFRLQAEGYKS